MKDEAYNILRKWIMIGKLEPGAKLRNQDLSDTLGISRTPVREALLQLENDGLVVTKANRWTLVAPIDLESAKNIYSIVWSLESLALEQAFPRFSQADLEGLELLNEQLNKTMKVGDKIKALEIDNAFHDKIIEISNNSELPKLLASLKIKIQRIEIHYFSQNYARYATYNEHLQIIDTIKKQDLNSALQAIQNNWKNSLKRIQQST
ncbi:GntR family transcriptional regulator [Jeotgalibacillus marinus]|uniref:GntR family transcriptional regulator n=1 Tax=Jeotgalibacillus marinus TaxID=86667 RepID=A0ABV3Q314_9BACL